MADIDLKSATPDTSLPSTGFLFGADSQAAASPSVYSTQTVATALLGSSSLTGETVTADAPVLNMAQRWNNAAVTFTGLKFNVPTDTSAAGSLLMDLQVGGTSFFKLGKSGSITFGSSGSGANIRANGSGRPFLNFSGANGIIAEDNLGSAGRLGCSVNTVDIPDAFFTRRAAANLRLGAADAAAPVAQTLSVQSVVAGTTNTAGANLTITGSQGTGTGAGGSIVFQVAPAGSSGTAQNALVSTWQITGAGHLTLATDNTYDIGASGATRPRHGYFGGNLVAGGSLGLQIGNVSAPIYWSSRSQIYSPANGNILLQNAAQSDFDRLQFGGTTSSFPALKRSTTVLQARLADDSAFATIQGKLRADVNAVAETPTATHTITITDAAGTAYKVLCVAA